MSPVRQRARQMAGVAEERVAVPQRAGDDVAPLDLRHAPARQLELVVGGLVVEHAHGDHDPPPRRGFRRATRTSRLRRAVERVTEAILSSVRRLTGRSPRGPGGGLRLDCALPRRRPGKAVARGPAREWSTAGSAARRREAGGVGRGPLAGGLAVDAARGGEQRLRRGDALDEERARPELHVTSPVTRACEEASSASMSRQAGSRCWPSCTRSP